MNRRKPTIELRVANPCVPPSSGISLRDFLLEIANQGASLRGEQVQEFADEIIASLKNNDRIPDESTMRAPTERELTIWSEKIAASNRQTIPARRRV